MGLVLVNTAPGAVPDPIKPGQSVQLGLRTNGGGSDVISGDTQVWAGLSGIVNMGILPENDPNLAALAVGTALQTSEHRLPVNATVPRTFSGNSLVFTKGDNSDFDKGIYELSFPITLDAPVLGYFKFRTRTAWTQFNPDWLNLTNVVGMYFGIEHQSYNTGLFAFLRQFSPGHGSLVVGGPLPSFGGARPGQAEFSAFDWLALPNNSVVEMWLYFNTTGYPPPFSSPYVPVVEVWTMRDGVDLAPVVQAIIPVGTLGTFQPPASNFSNYRFGPGGNAVLYFGNVGRTGDVLQLDDWALFPDFRFAVNGGEALPGCERAFSPDSPNQYFAENAVLPQKLNPGRWLSVPDAGFVFPPTSFVFQPGRKQTPQSVQLAKTLPFPAAFQKREPRLEERVQGAMMEALMSGAQTSIVTDAFGAGLLIEDGAFQYAAVCLQTPTLTTIGIAKTSLGSVEADYYIPLDSHSNPLTIDWTSLHMVRLIVDRLRSKVALVIDETRVMEIAIGGTFPASVSGLGRMMFGHIVLGSQTGSMDVSRLTYLNRYKAWEIIDQKVPNDVTVAPGFSLHAVGASTVTLDHPSPNATEALITKSDFGLSGTHCYEALSEDLAEVKGVQVDFQAKVLGYTDVTGAFFKSLTWTGAGVQLWLGNKRLHLGFFDAGTNGRVLGIVPGSGSINDIINQTTLGQQFSTPVDWTQDNLYRIVCAGYQGIHVWIGSFNGDPVISIPWRNDTFGFDLPLDATASSVAFGHFDDMASSQTAWKSIRYGVSSGYDMSVNLDYPNGFPRFLFGGKVQVRSSIQG